MEVGTDRSNKNAPLLISPIEMRVLWTKIEYIKSAATLLDKNCVTKKV